MTLHWHRLLELLAIVAGTGVFLVTSAYLAVLFDKVGEMSGRAQTVLAWSVSGGILLATSLAVLLAP